MIKSGTFSVIGVGTVIINISELFKFLLFELMVNLFDKAFFNDSLEVSPVESL